MAKRGTGRIATWWLLLGAWVALVTWAVVWGLDSADDDLSTRTAEALQAAGIEGVVVDIQGRDAVVDLSGAAGVDAAAVEAVVLEVRGVREVRFEGGAEAAPQETAATAPAVATPPATTPTTTEPTPETTMPVPSTTLPPQEPLEAALPNIVASLSSGLLTVSGTIADAEAAGRLAVVTELIYAPLVDNQLTVDPQAPAADWVGGIADAAAFLPIVGTATLEIAGDQAIVTGVTGSEVKRAQLEGALQQILGPSVSLDNRIEVTGKEPPLYDASAPGDGTVILRGIMPDQASIDLIAGAAIEAYGPENVVNEMVIDDGVEATFSVFRLPFTFPLLQPVPQWEVHIENDVISGGLRGGATFAFGSAELTPELEQLAGIAAGILLRNPTVVMTIEGHTDSIGTDQFNQGLSEARADAGKAHIVALGVDPARLTAVGFGESRPIADNGTPEGRTQNRRLEFVMGATQGAG